MSTFIEKTQTTPAQTQTNYTNQYNDSSARKFITSDAVKNNSPTDSSSNVEFLIKAAAGASAVGLAVQSMSVLAKTSIKQVQDIITGTGAEPNLNTRSRQGQFDEADVSNTQTSMADAASSMFQNILDPNIGSQLVKQTRLFATNSRHQAMPTRDAGAQNKIVNKVVPEFESITIDIDRNSSTVDNFAATLLFNLPASSTGKIKAIRIFRTILDKPIYTRPLATLSSAGIDRLLAYRGRKNQDDASASQQRHNENSVPNAISKLNSVDPFTNLRVSADGDVLPSYPPPLAGQSVNPAFANSQIPVALQHLDASVLENINVLSNLKKNPLSGFDVSLFAQPMAVGQNLNTGLELGSSQSEQVRTFTSTSMTVIEANNKLDFQELAFLTTDKLKGRRVQGRMEYSFKDLTVEYGLGYKYFIVTVDENMIQSQRSSIITITVEGMRVPERPSTVNTRIDQTSVSLSITAGDQLVEKFEVYRFEHDSNRTQSSNALTIADLDGFSTRQYIRDINSNNYLLLGECVNPLRGGAQFIDYFVKPGHFYTFRVYAVDIFGNKSESPVEVEAYVPDLQQQYTYMQRPALLVEEDAATKTMSITFSCDDSNVETLKLERRDLTIGETAFTTPFAPSRNIFGYVSPPSSRKLLGEMLMPYDGQPDSFLWNGIFYNTTGTQQVFLDAAVQFDHIYQYRIHGVDRYGNSSPHAVSSPVLLVRRPLINAPLGLSASLAIDGNFNITGVSLVWNEANLDVAAEELIASQADLTDSAIRTMYSVQRKKKEEDAWQTFSLITGTVMQDLVNGISGSAPNFRPPYLDVNQTYQYRVKAVQTGVFVSNFTQPVEIFVGFNVAAPTNFIIRTPSVYLRPFYCMLNWGEQANSGVVDKWEIERVSVNNIAAAKLNMKNQEEFAKLNFSSFRTVYKESSRFSGKVQDTLFSTTQTLDKTIIVGQHCFMDTQVDLGNSYFYRIRAVSPEGIASGWVYKGIKLTSTVFEQKWLPVLTDVEKQMLSVSMSPMIMTKGVRKSPKSSISLQPDFSKPDSIRTTPRTQVIVGGSE